MSTGQNPTSPAVRSLPRTEFEDRVADLWNRYESCDLCAYDCGVDRTAGDVGACRVDDTCQVSSYFPHRGEERCLRGTGGSGTIFLTSCNMTCVFCQNFETSQEQQGTEATPEDIAEMALELQSRGCHNVNFVSPTHYSPHLVEAIGIARDRGLDVPIVWNCGGYERVEVLELLEDVVDIYMPDVKWSDDQAAAKYSHAPGYWENIKESLREMHRQVGDLEIAGGLATNGLLVRHLVMPGHVENAKDVLTFIAEEISTNTYVNVMAQYRPYYRAAREDRYDEINRRLTESEYQDVLDHAESVGLERVDTDGSLL